MLKRIITSIVALAILFPILWFSDTVVFCIAIGIISTISMFEMFRCMGKHRSLEICVPLYIFSAVSPFLMRYINLRNFVLVSFICAALYLLYLFTLIVCSHGKITFEDGAAIFTASLYIITSYNSIIYLRDFDNNGQYIYLLIFIGAWITDTFAYFTGYFFGKHKLIPDVSPKKTVEGSIGGIIFCSLFFVLYGVIVDKFFGQNANVVFLLISGIIISVISQIGDLIMSVIKRHYGIKDYGKIFPGHGGMLDRFDSILAVSLGLCTICMFISLTGITLL